MTSEPTVDEVSVMFLCTGNAARSVMAGMMLSQLAPEIRVVTAGTHVIEGHPISWRTRDAIEAAGFDVGHHRSSQVHTSILADIDVIVGLACEHVAYIRRQHSEAAARTATLKRLCRDLTPGPEPLADRIAALQLASVNLEPWEDVLDPAGGELPDFVSCAEEVRDLVNQFAVVLTGGSR